MTGRTPATAQDTADLQRRLARMPFAGDTFAPFVKAVEFDPLPPINAKGGRDCEGWVAVYEGTVQQTWVNGIGEGGLHGAAASWLVDMITGSTFGYLHTPTWRPWGPSISLDVNYYSAAPVGTKMRIEVIIDKMSASLCTARCVFSEWDTGRRIAAGMHTTMTPRSAVKKPAAKL